MVFEFELNITKEYLLTRNTAETYMEHYLGLPCIKGKLYRSPLRVDHSETCAFFVDRRGNLIFKDFSGDFYGDFVNVVMEKFGCTYYKALRVIANDFGYIKEKNLQVNEKLIDYTYNKIDKSGSALIQVQIQDFTEKDLKWWKMFGITKKTLEKFHVFSCKTVFLNGSIFSFYSDLSPSYGYYNGKNDDGELWRIYYPKRKQYRFISNWSSKMIQGIKQLPKKGDLLIITKSLKDVMSLYECGYTAIAPNSESIFITPERYENLKSRFKEIILIYDNDLPGISAMNKIRKNFPDLKCTFIPRSFKCKDISDFVKKYGIDKTKEKIKLYLEWQNSNGVQKDSY